MHTFKNKMRLVLFSLGLASCGGAMHQITSTPPGAQVFLREGGIYDKPNPDALTTTRQTTPFQVKGTLPNRWYQVRMDGYQDSEVVFLQHGTWQGPQTHHFTLRPLPASARPSTRAPLESSVILAVFDIEDATGQFKTQECEQLQDFLSTRLTELAGLKVVPRQQLRERLREQQSESYRQCYDEACQIELGKEIAASKSVSTRILKVGTSCVVTSKLFDLKSATSERAASARVACTADALLDGMDQIARQLTGVASEPEPARSHAPPPAQPEEQEKSSW